MTGGISDHGDTRLPDHFDVEETGSTSATGKATAKADMSSAKALIKLINTHIASVHGAEKKTLEQFRSAIAKLEVWTQGGAAPSTATMESTIKEVAGKLRRLGILAKAKPAVPSTAIASSEDGHIIAKESVPLDSAVLSHLNMVVLEELINKISAEIHELQHDYEILQVKMSKENLSSAETMLTIYKTLGAKRTALSDTVTEDKARLAAAQAQEAQDKTAYETAETQAATADKDRKAAEAVIKASHHHHHHHHGFFSSIESGIVDFAKSAAKGIAGAAEDVAGAACYAVGEKHDAKNLFKDASKMYARAHKNIDKSGEAWKHAGEDVKNLAVSVADAVAHFFEAIGHAFHQYGVNTSNAFGHQTHTQKKFLKKMKTLRSLLETANMIGMVSTNDRKEATKLLKLLELLTSLKTKLLAEKHSAGTGTLALSKMIAGFFKEFHHLCNSVKNSIAQTYATDALTRLHSSSLKQGKAFAKLETKINKMISEYTAHFKHIAERNKINTSICGSGTGMGDMLGDGFGIIGGGIEDFGVDMAHGFYGGIHVGHMLDEVKSTFASVESGFQPILDASITDQQALQTRFLHDASSVAADDGYILDTSTGKASSGKLYIEGDDGDKISTAGTEFEDDGDSENDG
jgi:hypothetical protein